MTRYLVTIARGWDLDLVRGVLARIGEVDDDGCEHIPRLVNLRTNWGAVDVLTIEGVESVDDPDDAVLGADQSLTWAPTEDHAAKDNIGLAMLSWPTRLLGAGNIPHDTSLSYDFDRDGSGVDIYLVDAEVPVQLAPYAGRVVKVFDAHNKGPGEHAAMMCGPLNTPRLGVAKGAMVYNAVALDPSAAGSIGALSKALNACLAHYQGRAATDRPAVLSVSIGIGPTWWGGERFSAEVAALTDAGILVCAAAMNGGVELVGQERQFPACLADAVCVGNCLADERREYSNYGDALDLYACGGSRQQPDSISLSSTTYSLGGNQRYGLGTSSATPHVAATAACLLTGYRRLRGRSDVAVLRMRLMEFAKQGRVTNVPVGPRTILHKPGVLPLDPLGIHALWSGLPEPPPEPQPEPIPEPAPVAGFFVPPPPTDEQFVQTCIGAGGFLTFVERSYL